MGMGVPKYLEVYLNNQSRVPLANFVNNADYYANLDYYWITYMNRVVRKCIAYGTHTVDGIHNSILSSGTGYSIVQAAAKLIVGERTYFEGNDESCAFLSDIWSEASGFSTFLDRAIKFMLLGGTCPIKLNIDAEGRTSLSAYRIDRSIVHTNDTGNVTEAIFYIGLISSLKSEEGGMNYWLVEHRKYDDNGNKVIQYKVFRKSSVAGSEILPDPYLDGISYKGSPKRVQRELNRLGIGELNTEIPLPIRDGLGVWLLRNTSSNSCIPDSYLGDPVLYNVTDLLWSIDVVFTGSLTDVINGRGKILVPKPFLSEVRTMLSSHGIDSITTRELDRYDDESFVYIQPSVFDKDKQSPTPIQFDIRSTQYRELLELYEKEAAVRAGYSPNTIFPHLANGNSVTATQFNGEENLTRASVQHIHKTNIPQLNRAIKEVLYQENYSTDVNIRLSDYIGNKIQRDENLRANYLAKGMSHEEFVQQINNYSHSETLESIEKIKQDELESMTTFSEPNPSEEFKNVEVDYV